MFRKTFFLSKVFRNLKKVGNHWLNWFMESHSCACAVVGNPRGGRGPWGFDQIILRRVLVVVRKSVCVGGGGTFFVFYCIFKTQIFRSLPSPSPCVHLWRVSLIGTLFGIVDFDLFRRFLNDGSSLGNKGGTNAGSAHVHADIERLLIFRHFLF